MHCLSLAKNCHAAAIEIERSASEVVDCAGVADRIGNDPTPVETSLPKLHFGIPYTYSKTVSKKSYIVVEIFKAKEEYRLLFIKQLYFTVKKVIIKCTIESLIDDLVA